MTRTVYDTILDPTGAPIEGFRVQFTVKPSTSTLDATYPQETITVETDAAGYYEVQLATGILYEVGLVSVFKPRGTSTEYPRGSLFTVVVPEGEGKVSVPSVRIAGMTPPTPSVVDAVTAIIDETVQGAAASAVPELVPGEVDARLAATDFGPYVDPLVQPAVEAVLAPVAESVVQDAASNVEYGPLVSPLVPPLVIDALAADDTPAQAAALAVDAEIAGRELVEGARVGTDEIDHGFVGQDGGVSWLAGTPEGLPPQHSRQIIAEAVAPALQNGLLQGLPEEMPSGSGWSLAIVDADDRVAFGVRNDGTIWPEGGGGESPNPHGGVRIEPMLGSGTLLRVREPDGSSRLATSTTDVAFYGDSLTKGHPVPPFASDGSNSLPGAFAALHPSGSVFNGGYTSKVSEEIAIWQGGLVIDLLPAGGAIPASGGVTVTTPQTVEWRTDSPWQCPGSLAGVPGTLARSGTTLTFTRSAAGDPVPVAEPTEWVSSVGTSYRDRITVLLPGRNDTTYLGGDPRCVDRVIGANAAIIGNLTPRHPRFLVLGTITSTSEYAGSRNHTLTVEISRRLKALYPDNFLDLRRWLIDEAMDVMGLTPTADDIANIERDTIPPSLMTDTRHWTPAAAAAIAGWLHDEMTERGWLA